MKNSVMIRVHDRLFGFAADQSGSATMLSLQFVLIMIVMGGLAIDFNKAMADRTRLQVAADTAAHSALYARETQSAEAANALALDTIDMMLRDDLHGGAITTSDVTFGEWDLVNHTFTANPHSKTAVRIVSEKTLERGNPARNLLLRAIGFKSFDVRTASTYSTYFPPCFTEGFVADKVVDIQSGNAFTDGFCIHSNDHVSLNQNNYFEPGTVVSMPDLANLDMPNSGFKQNEGLETALRQGKYRLRLLNQLPGIIDGLWFARESSLPQNTDGYSDGTLIGGEYSGVVAFMPSLDKVTPADFVQGRVNRMNCFGSGKLTMEPGVYWNIVFVSDCEIKFSNGVVIEDSVIATTNTSAISMNSPAGFTLGRDDDCATGGGAVLMTLGGVNVAAGLNVNNGQILALGDIEFAANADGIQGASFVSMGRIEGTSNMNMGFCRNRGMENLYRANYFRMVD